MHRWCTALTQPGTSLSTPLAPLEKVPERRDNHNNSYFEPKQKKELVGAYTRLVYLIPPERSPLEVVGNYADEVKRQGGKVLFECRSSRARSAPR